MRHLLDESLPVCPHCRSDRSIVEYIVGRPAFRPAFPDAVFLHGCTVIDDEPTPDWGCVACGVAWDDVT